MTPKFWSPKVLSILKIKSELLLETTKTIEGWCWIYVAVDRLTKRMEQAWCLEEQDFQRLVMERKMEQIKEKDLKDERMDEGVSFDLTETYYPSAAAHSWATPPVEKAPDTHVPAWASPPKRRKIIEPPSEDFVLFGD